MSQPTTIIRQRLPHEPRSIPNGQPRMIAEGRIGSIVQFPVLVDEGAGFVEKNFEKFVRPPGTRIIAVREGKIYLQQEARIEQGNVPDWRLPGGKVFDSFKEFQSYLTSTIPLEMILTAARKELREEAGLAASSVRLFQKQLCGATVEWDLYYIVAEGVASVGEVGAHNEGEDIRSSGWFTFAEILDKCQKGEIGEGRSVAALIQYMSAVR